MLLLSHRPFSLVLAGPNTVSHKEEHYDFFFNRKTLTAIFSKFLRCRILVVINKHVFVLNRPFLKGFSIFLHF